MYLKDFEEDLPATVYAIYFFKHEGLTKQDIAAIDNKLERCVKKYPYVSFLRVISNTRGKYCLQRKIKIKNQKGKPPIRVIGRKVNLHIHLCIMGDKKKSAYKCAKEIEDFFCKRCKQKCCMYKTIGKRVHAKNFIKYSLKQSFSTRKNGKFNELLVKGKIIETKEL